MDKKTSSQPILLDDQRQSSTKDLGSQIERDHKMPGTKTVADDAEKATKNKGAKKK